MGKWLFLSLIQFRSVVELVEGPESCPGTTLKTPHTLQNGLGAT